MLSAHPLFYFNSTMVRLKVNGNPRIRLHLTYFNSTMVRLKETFEDMLVFVRPFQFHYGTIKSMRCPCWIT